MFTKCAATTDPYRALMDIQERTNAMASAMMEIKTSILHRLARRERTRNYRGYLPKETV